MDIERLKELAEKATPGPWSCPIEDHDSVAANVERRELPSGNIALSALWISAVDMENRDDYDSESGLSEQAENDRQYIAAADPQTVLGLIAEVERLNKALDQAIDCASLSIETVVKDKSYGMWRYEGETVIVGRSSTENFFAGFPDDSPELASVLKERGE